MYEVGTILWNPAYLIRPGKEKEKYLIILESSDDSIYYFGLTTSQIYVDASFIKHGRIVDREYQAYCFIANKIIGCNGFYFPKDTFISHRDNCKKITIEQMQKSQFEVKDVLIKEELSNLLYSYHESKHTPDFFIPILENRLSMLLNE